MTKQLVLAVLAAGLHSSRAFAPSPALLRAKASSGPLRSVLRYSTGMVAETAAPPATTLAGGLPSWMRASAPVQDWVDCGDMANLTYKHSKELTAISPAAIEADLSADLKTLKYELVTALYTRCPGRRSETVFAGFVAKRTVSEGVIDVFVAWRGTILSDEWNLDASFDLVPAPLTNNLHVHQGFINLYTSTTDSNGVKSGTAALQQLVSDSATTVRRVFVTGHSLGGALATLSAYDIARNVGGDGVAPTLITFSGPRAASVELAIELNRVVTDHTRIFSDGDLVPASPLYLGEKLRRNNQLAEAIINDINDQKDGISATTALTAVHKAARALDNAINEAVARGEQPTAQYHHAGAGVVVSAAALPDEPAIRAIPWTIGNHHNLAMILYLLDPTDARLELMKQQFKV